MRSFYKRTKKANNVVEPKEDTSPHFNAFPIILGWPYWECEECGRKNPGEANDCRDCNSAGPAVKEFSREADRKRTIKKRINKEDNLG